MTPQDWKEIRAEVLRRIQRGDRGSLPGDELQFIKHPQAIEDIIEIATFKLPRFLQ